MEFLGKRFSNNQPLPICFSDETRSGCFNELKKSMNTILKEYFDLTYDLKESLISSCNNIACVLYNSVNSDLSKIPTAAEIVEKLQDLRKKEVPNEIKIML